jgi:branched-chain amino acid transport system ATP-binding protein
MSINELQKRRNETIFLAGEGALRQGLVGQKQAIGDWLGGLMEQDILLRARDLESGYGDVQVLWGVSIDVRYGSIVAIVGANGAGKTTLLMTLCGAIRPTAGSIEFSGRDITGAPPHISVSEGMAYVPEGRRLFKTLSVRDNLLLGAYNRPKGSEIHDDLDRVFSLFPILRERQSQDASTLSGGEQQMCAVGRGIMARPKLLIIDELSLGLAPAVVESLVESLGAIRAQGVSILLVEQDVATAFEVSDYGYVLDTGRVSMQGPSQEMLSRPDVQRVYLGFS